MVGASLPHSGPLFVIGSSVVDDRIEVVGVAKLAVVHHLLMVLVKQ
jgi:hypothetical protein